MKRIAALAAMVLAAAVCVGCQAAKPVEIPVPAHVDLRAAAEIGDSNNGLWLQEGPIAASRIVDAMGEAGGASMTASVLELIPVERGESITGRSIIVTSRTDGVNYAAEVTVGDQHGEFVVIGQQVWVRGNEAFSYQVGVNVSEGHDAEQFVCMVRGSSAIAEFVTLADPAEFMRTALIGLEMGMLEPAPGAPEVQTLVLGTGGSPTGEVAVEAIGAPLPRSLFASDESGSVRADFSWGPVLEIRAPSAALGC